MTLIVLTNIGKSQNIGAIASTKWFSINGYVSTSYTNIKSDNNALKDINPNIFNISAGLRVNIKGLVIPLNFIYTSDRGSRFTTRSFTRLGISPYYKWVKLHLGESNISLSPYIFSGTTFNGIGLELTPKKLRFSAFYGNIDQSYFAPTTTFQAFPSEISLYERKGFGAKIGFGTSSSHFDIFMFKATDDRSSTQTDSLEALGLYAGENLAFGTKIKLSNKSVFLEINAGASAITENLNALPASSNEEDLRQIQRFDKLLMINNSSTYGLAYDARLGFNIGPLVLSLKYQHIDPFYTTFGIPYINNDLDHYLVDFSLSLGQGRFYINGSLGKEYNNTASYLRLSESRNIAALNINWSVSKRLSINGNFNNFSISNQPQQVEVADTLVFASSNFGFGTNINYRIGKDLGSKYINVSLNRSIFNFKQDGEITSTTDTRSYNLNYKQNIKHIKFNFSVGANISSFETHDGLSVERKGINLSLGKTLFKHLRIGLSSQALLNQTNNQSDGTIFNIGIHGNATLTKGLSFSLSTRYVLRQTSLLDPINTVNSRIQLKKNF